MTKRILPQIEVLGDGTTITRTPFNPEWVEALKSLIPSTDREYDSVTKQWTIYGHYHVDAVIELTRRHFPQLKVTDHRRGSSTRAVATLDADFARLHLLPSAPARLVQVAYRELAKESHPDRGGAHEVMLALNASYERLQQAGAA